MLYPQNYSKNNFHKKINLKMTKYFKIYNQHLNSEIQLIEETQLLIWT